MFATTSSRPSLRLMLPLLLASLLTACGGGGSSSGASSTPAPQTLTLLATASLDGYVLGSGGANPANGLLVGDLDSLGAGRDYRSFVSFDITGIPAGAQIQSAILRVAQVQVLGTPYGGSHGNLIIDHLDYGPSLQTQDFNGAAIQLAVGTLFTDGTLGYAGVDVTARLAVDRGNSSPRSQYRLRFATLDSDGDSINDYVQIEDAENTRASGNVPQLVVTYTIP